MRTTAIIGGLLVALFALTGCPQENGSGNDSGGKPKAQHVIEITFTEHGFTHPSVTQPAIPSGHWHKFIFDVMAGPAPTGVIGSVTADHTTHGPLLCIIYYMDRDGDLHVVDSAHDANPGAVTCRASADMVARSLRHNIGKPPPGAPTCDCKPDSLAFEVVWVQQH